MPGKRSERADWVNVFRDYLGLGPLPDLYDSAGSACKKCLNDPDGRCRKHGRAKQQGRRTDLRD